MHFPSRLQPSDLLLFGFFTFVFALVFAHA
jgi:hypothetical protein